MHKPWPVLISNFRIVSAIFLLDIGIFTAPWTRGDEPQRPMGSGGSLRFAEEAASRRPSTKSRTPKGGSCSEHAACPRTSLFAASSGLLRPTWWSDRSKNVPVQQRGNRKNTPSMPTAGQHGVCTFGGTTGETRAPDIGRTTATRSASSIRLRPGALRSTWPTSWAPERGDSDLQAHPRQQCFRPARAASPVVRDAARSRDGVPRHGHGSRRATIRSWDRDCVLSRKPPGEPPTAYGQRR